MKKYLVKFMFFIIVTTIISCGSQQKDNRDQLEKETPKALQDHNLEIKSLSRSNIGLSDELYRELVDKTPVLKELERDIDGINSKPNEFEEKFNTYEGRSNSYYSSVSSQLEAISDSVLRDKIKELIINSEKLYSNRTILLKGLIKQINKNNSSLNDHHIVLEIVSTLPIIEKYQTENIIDKNEFKDLLRQQQNLIERIEKLTPRF